jgi:hypothetical protein
MNSFLYLCAAIFICIQRDTISSGAAGVSLTFALRFVTSEHLWGLALCRSFLAGGVALQYRRFCGLPSANGDAIGEPNERRRAVCVFAPLIRWGLTHAVCDGCSIRDYTVNIPREPEWLVAGEPALPRGPDGKTLPWPSAGTVEFKDIVMTYRASLEPAIKGLTAKIFPTEKSERHVPGL